MICYTIGSLFSGIGGLELGIEAAMNAKTIWQVEQDESARAVLAKHWPSVDRSITDVKSASSETLARPSIICGGFPCQDISPAGKREGLEGAKSNLVYEMLRAIGDFRPDGAVFENSHHGWRKWVPIVRRTLQSMGYASVPIRVRACEVGAPHRRARCFLIAYPYNTNRQTPTREDKSRRNPSAEAVLAGTAGQAAYPNCEILRNTGSLNRVGAAFLDDNSEARWRDPPPGIRGVDDGLSPKVDRIRMRLLGNAVVPQCAAVAAVVLSKRLKCKPC